MCAVVWATVSMTRAVNPVHSVPVVGNTSVVKTASDWRESEAVRD